MAERSQPQPILLNPPPTRKWVTFQDWDEETGLLPAAGRSRLPVARRHSCSSDPAAALPPAGPWTVLSSSVSSESSLGSAGEGGQPPRPGTGGVVHIETNERRLAATDSKRNSCQVGYYGEEEDFGDAQMTEPIFNASFGGYKLNGEAATMKTMWQPPQRMSRKPRLSMSSSVSSVESEIASSSSPPLRTTSPTSAAPKTTTAATGGITCPSPAGQHSSPLSSVGSEPTNWLRFTAFDEVRSYEKTVAEAGPSNPPDSGKSCIQNINYFYTENNAKSKTTVPIGVIISTRPE